MHLPSMLGGYCILILTDVFNLLADKAPSVHYYAERGDLRGEQGEATPTTA
jgi:hypothetical protein